MYATSPSREERTEILAEAIRRIRFGALVLAPDGGLVASHLPMNIRACGETLILEGHVARANDLWRAADGVPALAIFQGPQAYIHPGWYPSKARDGRAVPTWNYVAVHAHGPVRALEDEAWLRRHLDELTAHNEADQAEPWAVHDAPADYIDRMLKGIVGLEMRINRLEGAWKMGQRQPRENRIAAAEALAASDSAGDREVGAIMARLEG